MLTSIAIILLFGLLVGWIFSKMKLPSLLGMIIVGIVLSPHCLNLVDDSILTISGDLRQIALVIILTRAGLSLNFSDLKKVGRPAILMCFVPACIEMMGTIIFAPLLLGVLKIDAREIFNPEMQRETPAIRQLRFLIEECSEQEAKALIPIIEAVFSVLRSKDASKIE